MSETQKIRLGDLAVTKYWFASVGCPAGQDVACEDGEAPDYPDSWADLTGTLDGNRWEWDGVGAPLDFQANTVQSIVAWGE